MNELDSFWSTQTSGHKLLIILLVLAALAVPIGIVLLMHDQEQVVLYEGLNEEDAARLTEKLNTLKIDYDLGQNGQTIYVDSRKVDNVRLQLVSEGVKPGNGAGYEIFDSLGYGVSDFAQKIHYQRAIQGELARSIMTLEAIQSARVLLVLPEEKLFDKQSNPAKASVILSLHDKARLSEAQIEGIQQLVASSVKGLQPGEVVISDERGVLLTHASHQSKNQATLLLNDKTRLEQHLAAKCETILAHVFGVDNAVVNINVTLAISEVNETRETVLTQDDKSNSGILVQRKRSVTRKTESDKDKGAGGNSVVQETSEDVYQTGKLVETKVKKPGEIVRISVSALVPTQTTDAQLTSIRQLLAATAGIDQARGDMLAVERLPTFQAPVIAAPAVSTNADWAAVGPAAPNRDFTGVLQTYRYPLIAIFSVIAIICLLLLLLRGKRGYALERAEKEQLLLEIRGWLSDDKRLSGTSV